MQQSSLPLAAIMGWLVLGDRAERRRLGRRRRRHPSASLVLSWPRRGHGQADLSGGLFGLASGAGVRRGLQRLPSGRAQSLDPAHPLFSATAALVVAQTMQSIVLTAILAVVRPQALRSVTQAWRSVAGRGLLRLGGLGLLVRRPGAGPRRSGAGGGSDRGPDRRRGGSQAVQREAEPAPVDRRRPDGGGPAALHAGLSFTGSAALGSIAP